MKSGMPFSLWAGRHFSFRIASGAVAHLRQQPKHQTPLLCVPANSRSLNQFKGCNGQLFQNHLSHIHSTLPMNNNILQGIYIYRPVPDSNVYNPVSE